MSTWCIDKVWLLKLFIYGLTMLIYYWFFVLLYSSCYGISTVLLTKYLSQTAWIIKCFPNHYPLYTHLLWNQRYRNFTSTGEIWLTVDDNLSIFTERLVRSVSWQVVILKLWSIDYLSSFDGSTKYRYWDSFCIGERGLTVLIYDWFSTHSISYLINQSNQIKSNQIKSNQIKSNQIKSINQSISFIPFITSITFISSILSSYQSINFYAFIYSLNQSISSISFITSISFILSIFSNQLINQSINQSIDQSINRSINRSINHITSHHITSHHITSHHITSHHITSHHITPHHINKSHHSTSLSSINQSSDHSFIEIDQSHQSHLSCLSYKSINPSINLPINHLLIYHTDLDFNSLTLTDSLISLSIWYDHSKSWMYFFYLWFV